MILDVLKSIFQRDLKRLKTELEKYDQEPDIWKVVDGISNCSGNLALHLVGNLQSFIGANLGDSGYLRKRNLEFTLKDVPREDLILQIEETSTIVLATLDKLTSADLEKEYPINVFGEPMTTEFFLVHLGTHLNYHLGQINYHRRIVGARTA